MIGGWWCGTIIAPMVFCGYCHSELVCGWVEQFLVEQLLPGQIVIIDNASFHPVEKIKKLIKQAGCEVIFLPTYSPDLNKIEKFWARLKNYVCKMLTEGKNLIDAVNEAFIVLS
jgi:transposase